MIRISTLVVCGLAIFISVASPVAGQSWPPTAESAYETALRWLAENNKFGPDSGFVNDMSALAKEEIDEGTSINFFFGADLMDSGTYKSMSIFNNRVMIFDLTEQQAAAMELESSSVTTTTSGSHGTPADKQSFELSNLVIQNAESIGSQDKFSGEVHCRALGDPEAAEYALRVSYRASQGVSQFQYLDVPPNAEGQTIAFEFSSVNEEGAEQPFKGPVALMFDIVHVDQSSGDVAIYFHSNLVGQIVSITD